MPEYLEYIKCDPDFKYRTMNAIVLDAPELKDHQVETHDILLKNGKLYINKFKYWNGTSGPTIDTTRSKVPSLGHDCLCELIELSLLPTNCLPVADEIFHRLCKECGVRWYKTRIWFRGLKCFSWIVVKPKKLRILKAPLPKGDDCGK